ncbi:MAG: dihydroxyacetone kinase subunit L [Lachnospiraceae bacterium]|nr:dihydroxyacetone kinase subunit L [Lachnospiraceae bacterium]
MNTITTTQLQEALLHACDVIIDAEGMLTELDTIIGDGDHGIGMKTGFSALRTLLQEQQFTDAFTLLKESGMMLIKVMGGTSGVIFGTMFIGGLSAVKDKDPITVQDFAQYIDQGTKAISVRGKVDRGAKTMYDALAEARDSMLNAAAQDADVHAFFLAGAEGAERGAEATKPMQSRMGRSKNFRDRTVGHPDSGAVSTSLIFRALSDYFS